MITVLRGVGIPPAWVGFARGLLEAVLMGALAGGTIWLGETEDLKLVAPIGFLVIRFLEGLVDQIDPAKTRSP